MTDKLAPVDLRVDSEGAVWHVGNPAVRGKGAKPTVKELERDEVKFIGPDALASAPWIELQARLVALTDEERALVVQALILVVSEATPNEDARTPLELAKRLSAGLPNEVPAHWTA